MFCAAIGSEARPHMSRIVAATYENKIARTLDRASVLEMLDHSLAKSFVCVIAQRVIQPVTPYFERRQRASVSAP